LLLGEVDGREPGLDHGWWRWWWWWLLSVVLVLREGCEDLRELPWGGPILCISRFHCTYCGERRNSLWPASDPDY
jgi:hypothetical protein